MLTTEDIIVITVMSVWILFMLLIESCFDALVNYKIVILLLFNLQKGFNLKVNLC
jgi:hypothetical protein